MSATCLDSNTEGEEQAIVPDVALSVRVDEIRVELALDLKQIKASLYK